MVSAESVKKQNDTFFWKKVFFDMVEKVGFTNCVFEKLCFPENTIFIVFSAKHSFSKKNCMLKKNRKFMKNSGLFLNIAKWCFVGLFLEVLILKGLFLVCLALLQVLKMLVFPCFGGFSGWLIVVHLGLEGLGVFVFLVFVFLFCVAFVSVLFALFLVLWLDVVVLLFLLLCFFVVFFFVFLEGLRVR